MTSPEPQTDFGNDLSQTSYEQPPQQQRWLRLLLALILILGGGTAIVWRLLTPLYQPPAINAQPPGVRVKVAAVQTGTIEDSKDFIASLESRRSVNLQPSMAGQITQIFVKPGDVVTTGMPIIQIDPRVQRATVNGNNAADLAAVQLENARATLRALELERLTNIADVQMNQQDYQRYASLADQGAVSRQTKDLSANRLATARANLSVINSRIQAQKASISQAERALELSQPKTPEQQVRLEYYKITAPFSGTVGNIPAKIGDFVNTTSLLATISQSRPLEVNISVPLERGEQLRKGMLVEIMNAQGQVLGTSRVFAIQPMVSNGTPSILMKALFNNTQNQLRADQLVRAKVIWSQRPGVLIPTTAVSRVAGENFVYVAKSETNSGGITQLIAEQRRVKLGNIKQNYYQVIDGLQPQDEIVVSGLLNLKDGVSIVREP